MYVSSKKGVKNRALRGLNFKKISGGGPPDPPSPGGVPPDPQSRVAKSPSDLFSRSTPVDGGVGEGAQKKISLGRWIPLIGA